MKNLHSACIIFILVFMFPLISMAQNKHLQTIRGKVTDKESQESLIGVNLYINSLNTGTTTNENGDFELKDIPVGRHTLSLSYLGYMQMDIPEVLVSSGKEVILNINMKEDLIKLQEVVITGNSTKGEVINSMATLSARSFNVEETRRYPGGLDDPARLASVFAGVATTGNVESNAIIIRGNAPTGVMWQVEGVEVSTPSHFANADVMGGGAVSLFSNQILSNSNFYTGAFPAEFGNASAGVFDVNLRTGNNRKYEHSVSIGVLGLEASTEGPFKKGSDASYLINYRYSTFGLVKAFLPQHGLPVYQDLCFKINLPTQRLGTFSLWGIGGIDNYSNQAKSNPAEWTDDHARLELNSNFYPGSAGLKHHIRMGKNTYLQSTVAASSYSSKNDTKWMDTDMVLQPKDQSKYSEYKFTLKSVLNHKFNARLANRSGMIANRYQYNYNVNHAYNTGDTISPLIELANSKGDAMSYQLFTQFRYDLNQRLSFNAGIHSMYFDLNKKYTLEPRLGVKYGLTGQSSFSFAYGLHSQMQMLNVYFLEKEVNGTHILPNKNLDFMKAHHFVLGYDHYFNDHLHLRIEPYYQYLYDIPVEQNTSFAIINLDDPHGFDKELVSEGIGYNYGMDVTFERFLNQGFYYMSTLSLFQSKYKGGDDIERNTRYNYNYVVNLLAGKEWNLGKKGKNNLLGLSGRLYLKGGDRSSPVDIQASEKDQMVVYDETRAFEESAPMLYRLDISATYRINKEKVSHVFAVQMINALGSPSMYNDIYDYTTQTVREEVKGSPFPSISWKVEF